MKTIKPINQRPCNGGIQKIYKFKNGYGASVVKHDFSYGGKSGKWELAVLSGKNQGIDYSTPITGDVIGWLSPAEVQKKLQEIKSLKRIK